MAVAPDAYAAKRLALGYDAIPYGVGGIQLFRPELLESAQVGFSVDPDGASLTGEAAGDWRADWVVIGCETACGDPVFLSVKPPYPVFTAIEEDEGWSAAPVAPSLESFWACLAAFRGIARNRGNTAQLDANPLTEDEIRRFFATIEAQCPGDEDAMGFWLVQAEVGMAGAEE